MIWTPKNIREDATYFVSFMFSVSNLFWNVKTKAIWKISNFSLLFWISLLNVTNKKLVYNNINYVLKEKIQKLYTVIHFKWKIVDKCSNTWFKYKDKQIRLSPWYWKYCIFRFSYQTMSSFRSSVHNDPLKNVFKWDNLYFCWRTQAKPPSGGTTLMQGALQSRRTK